VSLAVPGALGSGRRRSLFAFALLVLTSAAAGYAIYAREGKLLALIALFTVVVLLRRWSFSDFYFMTLAATALSHVHIGAIQDEFDVDKWIALFALAGLSVAVLAVRVGALPWPRTSHLLAGSFVLLAAYSVTWSSDPWLTFQKAGVLGAGVFVAFVGAWCYGITPTHVRQLVHAQVDLTWLVFPLGLVLLPLQMPGLYLAGRYRSIFENPNNLGIWASQTLPLAFGLMLDDPSRTRRRAAAVLFGSALLVAFFSGSRGGVGGAAIGIGVYALLRWTGKTSFLALVAAVVIAFVIAYGLQGVFLTDSVERLVRPDTLSDLSDRRVAWDAALLIGAEKPWWGHGFGLGNALYGEYGFDFAIGHFGFSVHSVYLETYMNLGRIGTGLLILIVAFGAWTGFRAWRLDPRGRTGLLALALTGSILATAAHGVVEVIFVGMGNPWSLPFWVDLALVAQLHRLLKRGLDEGPVSPPDTVAAA